MAVFRVHKNDNFITMGKHHFKQKKMSLKAIGLLSLMLSLPDDWDYSVSGLTAIRCESKNTINGILKELEEFGYLKRTQKRNQAGIITGYEYDIYEEPYLNNPYLENPYLKNRDMENYTQLNNNKVNNKELNNKEYKKFIKPTLEEIQKYIDDNNLRVNANNFFDYYESNGWRVGHNPMKSYQATLRRWSRTNNDKVDVGRPSWIDHEVKREEATDDELEEMNKLLEDFK